MGRLAATLLAACPKGFDVLPAPYDWVVGPRTSFQPDIIVARTADLGPLRLERLPALAVEVLSPSTRLVDLNLKRAAYEAAGVPAFWIVDPEAPSLTALSLDQDGRYSDEVQVEGSEPYRATLPFDMTVVPADLLRAGAVD